MGVHFMILPIFALNFQNISVMSAVKAGETGIRCDP